MAESKNKIVNLLQANEVSNSNAITLITGSFDLLHLGHLRFIHQAKLLAPANKLLLITLSDQSIKSRKGDDRPIFTQNERLEMLSYIEDIDYILLWEQPWENLRDFVGQIKPKLLVVNADDSGLENKQKVIEAVGGKLVILKRDSDHSTSNIINRIRNS